MDPMPPAPEPRNGVQRPFAAQRAVGFGRHPSSPPFPFEAYRRMRFARGNRCPRCQSSEVLRWGGYAGRRRYRCQQCGRTFSDFTGTPLAGVKKIDRWLGHCEGAVRSETLRCQAARLGIHRNTAFRWRHRLLNALQDNDTGRLDGIITARETTFPRSAKGARSLDRPGRRRGWAFGWELLRAPSVWVMVARANSGRVASGLADLGRPSDRDYARLLGGRLGASPSFATSGKGGALQLFARRIGSGHVCRAPDQDSAGVAQYVMRLLGWIRRFNGVATRYLGNYLTWHRFLHAVKSAATGFGAACRRLLKVEFP